MLKVIDGGDKPEPERLTKFRIFRKKVNEFNEYIGPLEIVDAIVVERLIYDIVFAGIESMKESRDLYLEEARGSQACIKRAENELAEWNQKNFMAMMALPFFGDDIYPPVMPPLQSPAPWNLPPFPYLSGESCEESKTSEPE